MFGYHDSNRCEYDLWSPKTTYKTVDSYSPYADRNQQGYGVWEDTPYHTAIENRAFSPYAKHSQEVEDVIQMIANGYSGGIETDDDFSEGDMRYIENELYNRYGIEAHLS